MLPLAIRDGLFSMLSKVIVLLRCFSLAILLLMRLLMLLSAVVFIWILRGWVSLFSALSLLLGFSCLC